MVTKPACAAPVLSRTVEDWWHYLDCELEPDGSVRMSLDDGCIYVTPWLITHGAQRDCAGRLVGLQHGDEGRLAVFLSAVARRDEAALTELHAARPSAN